MENTNEGTMKMIEIPGLTESQKLYKTLTEGLISHDSRITTMREDIKDIDKRTEHLEEIVISGNGELSLRERVRILEKLAAKAEKVANTVIIQTIAFVFTMIGMGVAFFVKVYPILVNLASKP